MTNGYYLVTNHDNSLFAVVALKQALDKSTLVIRYPDRLLRVVGFHHVLPFRLVAAEVILNLNLKK